MRYSTRYFTLVLLLSFAGYSYAQPAVNKKDLPNFHQVNARIYRGGQPTREGISRLKSIGIKTIVNLRSSDGKAKREKDWALGAGIGFVNVPLSNWFGPEDPKIEKILKLLNTAKIQPVFIHCKRGSDRTGTVIAVYRITRDGYTAKMANKEAKEFGFGWWQFWMKDYIKDYYKDFAAKK